ncbi:hypothetical protein COT42_00850 [Candidatus Saganbacteria bacterium CG08_land_8_20_14_0_20_45_16]|uniref:Uncharacterized protein n=1 Tax=Candidatus Saganbacteria bacterium CG08_land_8_20_14_0_20_45_16 TaxID=2014293 RepID=A0A2H0Y1K8_UNCSA|nr:MAG: hypothetical protein COT42_00850 [Candidatus Saganbacteria bacterium CG08_land_8_20_14_0_20_45_16]
MMLQQKPDKEITKYLAQVRNFQVKASPVLSCFERLLMTSEHYLLERSCKLQESVVFPGRFIIFYLDDDLFKNLQQAFVFFEQVSQCPGVKLDADRLMQIINKGRVLGRLEQLIVGIDLRPKLCDSRVKLWFKIGGLPQKNTRVVSLLGRKDPLLDLILHRRLLVGLDLFLNGASQIKVYPGFDKNDLRDQVVQQRLAKIFSGKIMVLINQSQMLHVMLKSQNRGRVLQFHPQDRLGFIKGLKNKQVLKLDKMMRLNKKDNRGLVALAESEIKKSKITSVGLYLY